MNEITVKTQEEWDAIPRDFDGIVYINADRETVIIVKEKRDWRVVAWGNSSVVAWGNSSVEAWGNSSVVAWGNSSVVARENSSVVAWGNSSVVAWGNSSVEAWGNSSVVGKGNTQIAKYSDGAKLSISGNARIVTLPETVEEYCDFYGAEVKDGHAVLYKAVHKAGSIYHSNHDHEFEYKIGATVEEKCDTNTDYECSFGLHVSHRAWALDFGRGWRNLAIIECLVPLDCIVVPKNGSGKVRTSKLTVVREIPLEECGAYGKMLAKERTVHE